MHKHKCGFNPVNDDLLDSLLSLFGGIPQPKGQGCGYEWEHEQPTTDSEQKYQAAHLCPQCGAGPWLYKVEEEGERHPKAEEKEERRTSFFVIRL